MPDPRKLSYTTLLWRAGAESPTLVRVLEVREDGWLIERIATGNGDLLPKRELLSKAEWSAERQRAAKTPDEAPEEPWGAGFLGYVPQP